MKRVFFNEKWCFGSHLCEYNCAYADFGIKDMAKAPKGKEIYHRIRAVGIDKIAFAVPGGHCADPICINNFISADDSVTENIKKILDLFHYDIKKCRNILESVV